MVSTPHPPINIYIRPLPKIRYKNKFLTFSRAKYIIVDMDKSIKVSMRAYEVMVKRKEKYGLGIKQQVDDLVLKEVDAMNVMEVMAMLEEMGYAKKINNNIWEKIK